MSQALDTKPRWRVWGRAYMLEKTARIGAIYLSEIQLYKAVVIKKVFGKWVVLYWK